MKKISSLLLATFVMGLTGCIVPNTSGPLNDNSLSTYVRVDQGVDLDWRSQVALNNAFQYAMQTGQTVYWRSGDVAGVTVAKQKFITSTGQACRYFATRTRLQGSFYITRGEGCRSSQGVWLVQ